MTATTDNFYVQAQAMRGSSCASAGIRLCEEAERIGRPLTKTESADLRLPGLGIRQATCAETALQCLQVHCFGLRLEFDKRLSK